MNSSVSFLLPSVSLQLLSRVLFSVSILVLTTFYGVETARPASASSGPDPQRTALENFYKSTGGPGWSDHTGWLEGDYCPDPVTGAQPWFGLVCDEGQNVMHLNLERNNLHGTLNPDLFTKLPMLRHANFATNELSGPIPQSLCNAPNLRKLFLQINPSLSGTLPCLPATLDTIIIEQTQVGGPIPNTLSGELKVLILSGSRFEGTIPDIFDSMPNLEIVIMNGRTGEDGQEYMLKGTIPESMWHLSKLQFLALQFNRLEGTLGSFKKMKAINSLHLNNNQLSGSIPPSLAKAFARPVDPMADGKPDRHLHLENNQFTGTLSKEFNDMEGVTELGLANNRLTGYVPNNFKEAVWQWFPEKGQAFASNDWLPPIPEWAAEMGAAAAPLQMQQVKPPVIPNPKVNITIGGDSLIDLPNLGCAISTKPVELGSPCELPHCIITPATYDEDKVQYACKAVELESDVIGSLSVSIVFLKDPFMTNGADNHIIGNWVTLVVYEPHPQLESVDPVEGRWQGCTNVTLRGYGFVNTRQNYCYFNGAKGTRVEATYVDPSTVTCSSPPVDSKKNLYQPQTLVFTPNNGGSWSKPAPGITFTYTDFCPLSAYDSRSGGAPCECNQCPCTSVGTCVWQHTRPTSTSSSGSTSSSSSSTGGTTPKGPYCTCPTGFTGDNCEKCQSGRWGPNCTLCECKNNGICHDGRQSDGSCSCLGWYAGKHCEIYYKSVLSTILAVVGAVLSLSAISLMVSALNRRCGPNDGSGANPNEDDASPLLGAGAGGGGVDHSSHHRQGFAMREFEATSPTARPATTSSPTATYGAAV